jgi:hypothetical protein
MGGGGITALDTAGGAGQAYGGGGGSGAGRLNCSGLNGGAGAAGMVMIEY